MTCNRLEKGMFVAVAIWGIFSKAAGAAEEKAKDTVGTLKLTYNREIALYLGAAPDSEKWDWSERSTTSPTGLPMAMDVVRPVLLHYPAEKGKAVGTAMIVAPGGGFRVLMMSYEGEDIARRLNAMGIDAFVLKYRLLYTGPGAPPRRAAMAAAQAERPRHRPTDMQRPSIGLVFRERSPDCSLDSESAFRTAGDNPQPSESDEANGSLPEYDLRYGAT